MLLYNPLNFIYPYNLTDRAVRIVGDDGKIVYTINVCAYQKSAVNGHTLFIVLEDNDKEYKLNFRTSNEAKQAIVRLRQVLDTLRPNCSGSTIPGGGGDPDTAPIAITYLQYKVFQQTNTLIPRRYYDVSDTTNLLFSENAYVFRLLPLTNNDKSPKGMIVATNEYVTIDAIIDVVSDWEDTTRGNMVLNGDADQSEFVNSLHSVATNGSRLILTQCDYVMADNISKVVGQSCSRIQAINGSDVNLLNASNSTFDNIQQNLSAIGFNLTNVNVDRNLSKGKWARTTNTNTTSAATLISYRDNIEQDYYYTTNNNTITLTLDNKIPQANGEFRIRYAGSGTGNQIVVKNMADEILYTLRDNDKTNIVIFTYNKSTALFELCNIESFSPTSGKTFLFTDITPNQINFNLNYPVSAIEELEMFVNGQKQIYGLDFSYDSGINQVVWAARQWMLLPGDEVEFKVY